MGFHFQIQSMRLGKEFKGLEMSPGSEPLKGFLPGDFRPI